jgi:hypothetical protein
MKFGTKFANKKKWTFWKYKPTSCYNVTVPTLTYGKKECENIGQMFSTLSITYGFTIN